MAETSPQTRVVALVGIAGTWTGSGRIYCSAEVADMIIGNVKTNLQERLGQLGLSTPTVIFGRRYQARSAKVHNWIVIPFARGPDIMEIRFCLVPASSILRTQVHRHEPALVGPTMPQTICP